MYYPRKCKSDEKLVCYLDEDDKEWYIRPDSKLAERPNMRRNETTWDKIKNKFL